MKIFKALYFVAIITPHAKAQAQGESLRGAFKKIVVSDAVPVEVHPEVNVGNVIIHDQEKKVHVEETALLAKKLAIGATSHRTTEAEAEAEEQHTDTSWVVIELGHFEVSNPDSDRWDWWSEPDVYARVKTEPSGYEYTTNVVHNSYAGSFNNSFYLPYPSSTVTVELWDRDEYFNDDLIGDAELTLTGESAGWTTASIGSYGNLLFTLAAGDDAVAKALELNNRGVEIDYSPRGAVWELARIKNDEVEHELAFAKTGSVFPEAMHGIFWMDQRGVHLDDYPDGPPGDPDYEQVGGSAADEILVSFGEAGWDPDGSPGGCATEMDIYGSGPKTGHWTWFDVTGDGVSTDWDATAFNKPVLSFCWEDAERTSVTITRYWEALGGVPFPNPILRLRMVVKPWGYDRVTDIGPGGILGVYHYPVWQVVDGNGQRTEHYEAYLAFANTQAPADQTESTFQQVNNRGNGTQLVARLVDPLVFD